MQIDAFLPNGAGNLQSQGSGVVLSQAFQPFTYVISGITNLSLRIEAFSTGDLEYLGFDFIQVSTPEPSTALQVTFGLGILAALGHRHRHHRASRR